MPGRGPRKRVTAILNLVTTYLDCLKRPTVENPREHVGALDDRRLCAWFFKARSDSVNVDDFARQLAEFEVDDPALILEAARIQTSLGLVEAKREPPAVTTRMPVRRRQAVPQQAKTRQIGMRPETRKALLKVVKGASTAEEALITLHTNANGVVLRAMEVIEKARAPISAATLRKLWKASGLKTVDSRIAGANGKDESRPPGKRTLARIEQMLNAVFGESKQSLQLRTATLLHEWGDDFPGNAREAGFSFTGQEMRRVRSWAAALAS